VNSPSPAVRLGDLLRAARQKRGLTLEELCGQAGLGVRTLGDLERHRIARPQRRTIEALVVALDLDDPERDAIWAAARPSAGVPEAAPSSGGPTGGATSAALFGSLPFDDLPADPGRLVGRDDELAELHAWIDSSAQSRPAPWPVIVSGLPGAGKTAFARQASRDLAEHFPGGRLVVDLGGSTDAPTTVTDALHELLERSGVPREQIPESAEDRGRLLRAQVGDRAMLIVLDDARDETQVRPLLPDSTRVLVVITSRRSLVGLDAAHRIALRELRPLAAVAMLETLAGRDRIAAEPAAAAALARLCGYLPLALGVAAKRLTIRPRWTVGDHVDRLSYQDERLSRLTAGDLRVHEVFERSYRHLSTEQQRVFRYLAVTPPGGVVPELAAVLLDCGADEAEEALEDLTDAGMLSPDVPTGRYVLNPLLRLYARQMLAERESAATIGRLHTAVGEVAHQPVVRRYRTVTTEPGQPGRAA
jgi:transcriptional regulator with XRE-family HTH domain